MGDIKQMYNQVKVPPKQQDLMRFLYWVDGDPSKEVIDCCLEYHMFGGSWSPSVCTYAIRKIIELAGLDPEGETAMTILRAFYVDDCVKSIIDVQSGITLFKEIISVFDKYHFDFTKLVSNKTELLDAFPEEKKAARTVDLDFDGGRVYVQHSLGQRWQPEKDVFFFVCCFKLDPATRRELLSTLSTLYDPLGLVAPFLIPAKRLLQELTRRSLAWDDELPNDVLKQWQSWVKDSECISQLEIPRWVGLSSLSQEVWLVYFCDASEVAYGAVCYICTVGKDGLIATSNLLVTRSRLAPLKSQSIPRLELCAALVAAELDDEVKAFLDVTPTRTLYWSDSTLVLRYINTEPSTLKTFVSNRVSAIQQLTKGEEWWHVPTDQNPADCLSRGTTAKELVDSELWLYGPSYLKENTREWPAQPDFLSGPSIEEEKKKPKLIYSIHSVDLFAAKKCHEAKQVQGALIPELWDKYSSWMKIIRTIAWLIFAIKRFKRGKSKEAATMTGVITCEEIKQASLLLIGVAQSAFLTDDITSKKSFKKLFPMKRDGLVCVGGRLERSSMPTEFKQPFVLAPANRVTELYVRHCHNEVFHAGVSRTLMETRKFVWVLQGRREVQMEVAKCLLCKKYRGQPLNQVMADLPPYRLQRGTRPFTYIGIDYLGPLQIKIARSLHKPYICVIVCSVTRAIHLKPAAVTLSEEAFNTVLCLVESSLNSRPLTKLTDDPSDASPITPNLLLLGDSGEPVRGVYFGTDELKRTWKQSQYMADCFWKRWTGEYLHELQARTKWLERKSNLKIGDLVMVVHDNMPRHVWPLGLVVGVHKGPDEVVRAADIKMASGVFTRPIVKLILLEADLYQG